MLHDRLLRPSILASTSRQAITGPSQVDENWKAQQEMLKLRK